MRLAVAATPNVAIPTLDWLCSSEHEIAFVVTQADRPAGRGKFMTPTAVGSWAMEQGIEILKPIAISELLGPLRAVDLLLTIAFGTILPIEVLSTPKFGSVNMHFSLLPKWRGAAPVQRAIENGDTGGGITVFAMDKGMDTGPIFLQREFRFPSDASSGEVLEALANLGPEIVSKTIEMISRGEASTPQQELGVSYAPKVTKAQAEIQWASNAEQIIRKIRAFTPEPGAWTTWRSSSFLISRATFGPGSLGLSIGELLVRDGVIAVGCGGGSSILVQELTPAGKKKMSAQAWLNGARIETGERFG
ncbi:MAG: methionyl-tRNA formyltransferase [Actinobacteria bacterium]|nr:methionyl-tRNA formyltransferase [Actinomycetota bacterium]